MDDGLLEWNYGDYEGEKTEAIREQVPGWNIFDYGAKNGESVEDVQKRGKIFLEALEKKYTGNVLCFSSGHISRALGGIWIGQGAKYGKYLALSTASLSILGYEHELKVIQKWNDTSHYEK